MSFIAELQRRNVIRVAVFYVVTAWFLLEVAELLFEILLVPDWGIRFVFGLLVLAFPLVLFLAWAYELTPDGLKRDKDVDRSQSVGTQTARKLDIAVIVVVILGAGVVWYGRQPMQAPAPEDRPRAESAPTPEPVARDGQSIAVLPFVNMSDDPENEYFADGLSEELLNVLAQVPDLLVAGRTSSFAFKGKNENLTAIGETLGVAHILEGSVRRQRDQVRITAQLVRAADGFHLWSQNYDRTLDDVFAIQDDIARNVVQALAIVLDDKARRRMEMAGVRNVDAFIAYQKGAKLYGEAHGNRPLLETLQEANRYFDQALELVPEFSAAWALWGDYYAHLLMEPDVPHEQRLEALEKQRLAFDTGYRHARDPGRKAFLDISRVLFSDDWSPLTDRVEQALAFEGCPSSIWTSSLTWMGYRERLNDLWRRQIECDPLRAVTWLNLAIGLAGSERLDESKAVLDQARMQLGGGLALDGVEVLLLIKKGQFDEATRLAEAIPVDSDFWGREVQVWPLAASGRIDEARARWAAIQAELGDDYLLGLSMLGPLGEREDANAAARVLDGRPAGAMILLNAVYACSCGAPFDLEATPVFAERLRESGLPWPPESLIDYPAKDW